MSVSLSGADKCTGTGSSTVTRVGRGAVTVPDVGDLLAQVVEGLCLLPVDDVVHG